MTEETTVITPTPEPEFSLENYRAERDGKPVIEKPSAEPEKAPEPVPESETGDKEQEQSEEQHAKGKGGFQRRIDKLVREKADLERQLAERPAAQPAKPAEVPVVAPAGEPKIDDFDSYDAYVAALTDWKVEQKFQAREAAQAKARADADAAAKMREFQQKAEAVRAKHDDFDEVVSDAPMTAAIRDFLMESDQAGEVAYALAIDRAELARISSLSPVAQIRALTALEAKFAPAPEAPKPKATKAPEPIRPVGTAAAPVTAFKADMSFEEYKRWRTSGGGR